MFRGQTRRSPKPKAPSEACETAHSLVPRAVRDHRLRSQNRDPITKAYVAVCSQIADAICKSHAVNNLRVATLFVRVGQAFAMRFPLTPEKVCLLTGQRSKRGGRTRD